MVPPEFLSFFIASTGAAAALVGLLFVAVSIAPEQIVALQAPIERQAVAGSAFTALMNAFFISLAALIPHLNFGTLVIPFSLLSLLSSAVQARLLLGTRKNWVSFVRRAFLVFSGIVLYGLEFAYGIVLIVQPTQFGTIINLIFALLAVFALGLVRAWELLGAHRYGFLGWLNPVQDAKGAVSSDAPANHPGATAAPHTSGESTPHSPPRQAK